MKMKRILIKATALLLFGLIAFPLMASGGHGDFKGYDNREGYYGEGSRTGVGGDRGDGATGALAAFLLALANLTVFLSLVLKGINRLFSFSQETKKSITGFNQAQKKYLRVLHYYLNPIAIIIAVIHFHMSTCRSILPDTALILFITISILGLMMKFNLTTKKIYKFAYSVHCSWVVFLSMILLITIGHAMI